MTNGENNRGIEPCSEITNVKPIIGSREDSLLFIRSLQLKVMALNPGTCRTRVIELLEDAEITATDFPDDYAPDIDATDTGDYVPYDYGDSDIGATDTDDSVGDLVPADYSSGIVRPLSPSADTFITVPPAIDVDLPRSSFSGLRLAVELTVRRVISKLKRS